MSFAVSFNEERAKIRGKERSHEREKRSELKLSDIEGYDNVMVRFGWEKQLLTSQANNL